MYSFNFKITFFKKKKLIKLISIMQYLNSILAILENLLIEQKIIQKMHTMRELSKKN